MGAGESTAGLTMKENSKVLPRPSSDLAEQLPPISLARDCEIAKPSPGRDEQQEVNFASDATTTRKEEER